MPFVIDQYSHVCFESSNDYRGHFDNVKAHFII
jgi:hypothetical protein